MLSTTVPVKTIVVQEGGVALKQPLGTTITIKIIIVVNFRFQTVSLLPLLNYDQWKINDKSLLH